MLTGRDWILLLLTWAAGSMDAVSYLCLDHVLTANMTGNTVLLSIAIGQSDALQAFRSLTSLVGFILGAALGARIAKPEREGEDWPPSVTTALVVEGCVMAIFAAGWFGSGHHGTRLTPFFLILLSAITMGMQSAAVRRLRIPGVVTTFITGTITAVVSELVTGARPNAPTVPEPSGGVPRKQVVDWEHRIELQIAVFIVYALGAIVTVVTESRLPLLVAVLPLIAIVPVILIAAIHYGPPAKTG